MPISSTLKALQVTNEGTIDPKIHDKPKLAFFIEILS
jgi:hypothetical protein